MTWHRWVYDLYLWIFEFLMFPSIFFLSVNCDVKGHVLGSRHDTALSFVLFIDFNWEAVDNVSKSKRVSLNRVFMVRLT